MFFFINILNEIYKIIKILNGIINIFKLLIKLSVINLEIISDKIIIKIPVKKTKYLDFL